MKEHKDVGEKVRKDEKRNALSQHIKTTDHSMLEVVGSSHKEAIFKNFKNLLVNFQLTTVINLHQTIFTQNHENLKLKNSLLLTI